MSTDITSVVLAVDSSQVTSAAAALDKMAVSGTKAEQASAKLEKSFAAMLAETKSIGTGVQELLKMSTAANSTAAATAKIAPEMAKVGAVSKIAATSVGGVGGGMAALGSAASVAGVANAAAAIQKISDASKGAKSNIDSLAAKFANEGARTEAAARALAGIRASAQGEDQRAYAAKQSFIAALRAEAEALGKTRTALLAERAARLGVTDQAKAYIDRIGQVTRGTQAFGATAKLTAQQTQQMSYQLNDFFVQVASGGGVLIPLIQQGSQLSGTFGGIGGAFRALGSTIGSAASAIGIAGAVIGGVVIAVGAVAVELYRAAEAGRVFENTLQLTGNAAGLTRDEFERLGRSIGESTRVGAGEAKDVLLGLTGAGRLGKDALEATTQAAILFGKATGQSADEVRKNFTGAMQSISRWAEESNKQYHFLTASQLAYIKTLEEQGRVNQATIVAMDALSAHVRGAAGNVSALERAYYGAANGARTLGAAIAAMARSVISPTVGDSIAAVRGKIAEAERARTEKGTGPGGTELQRPSQAYIEGLNEQLRALQKLAGANQDNAAAAEKSVQRESAGIAFAEIKNRNLSREAQLKKELAIINATADDAGKAKNDPERLEAIRNARERFAGPKGAKAPKVTTLKTELNADIKDIQNDLAKMTSLYAGAEAIIEATRAAGLIDEKEYFEKKRLFINLNANAQINALEQDKQRIQAEKVTGKDANDIANKKAALLQRVADVETRITVIRQDAATKGAVVNIQEKANLAAIEKSYKQAQLAAEDYFQAQQRAQASSLLNLSDRERKLHDSKQSVREPFENAQREIENARKLAIASAPDGKISDAIASDFERRLALNQEYQDKALTSWQVHYGLVLATQGKSDKQAMQESEEFFKAQQAMREEELAMLRMTDREKKRHGEMKEITSPFDKERREILESRKFATESSPEGKLNDDVSAAFDRRLELNEQYQQKALQGWQDHYENIQAVQGDWSNGARLAMQNYIDAADNVASQTADVFTSAFDKMGSALGEFITTGKLDFKGLARSIIADLIKIQAQAAISGLFKMVLGAFGGAAGGASTNFSGAGAASYSDSTWVSIPGRASGGPVSRGGLYEVNEKGPEMLNTGGKNYLMMGNRSGTVAANDSGKSEPATVNNVSYNVAAGVSRSEMVQALQTMSTAMEARMNQKLKQMGA